LSSEIFLKN
jgi:putative inorganic carbon (HCO3(-)) transporter